MSKLQEAINKASNPDLALSSITCQVWDDGEITSQKGGDLLWERTLHSSSPPINREGVPDSIKWPEKHGSHGFAFVTRDDAESIRVLIGEMHILNIKMEIYK